MGMARTDGTLNVGLAFDPEQVERLATLFEELAAAIRKYQYGTVDEQVAREEVERYMTEHGNG